MTISVIVPTFNEVERVNTLAAWANRAGDAIEMIISDGGSRDGTVARAHALGLRVVTGPKGRGQQLCRGASVAVGDILLFLHADTVLDDRAPAAMRRALTEPDIVGGNFRLLFSGDDAFSRWLTGFYAKLRARGLYYGDSAIFVRRGAYQALNGIRPIALMEDFDLVRRLERYGRTICIGDPPAVTSSRRFEGRRPARIVSQWLLLHALYLLGCPPGWLAWLYRSTTHRPAAQS